MVKQWTTQARRNALVAVAAAYWLAFASLAAPGTAQAHTAGAATPDHVLQEARIPLGNGTQIAPKYLYLFSSPAKWMGPMRWRYNHANAPASLGDKAAVVAQIRQSFDKWSSQCGISYIYEGETSVAPETMVQDPQNGAQPDGVSVVGWGAVDPSLGAWTYAWYAQKGNAREIFDADVTLNAGNVVSLADLDRLMTHEWGHALGLDHSDTNAAIMAGPPSTNYNALVMPQADDLRGCRCQYGLPGGVSAGYACTVPSRVDFGTAPAGSATTRQSIVFANSGNAPLSIQSVTLDNAQFRQVGGCAAGAVVMPGQSCTMDIAATPAASGTTAARLSVYTSDGYYDVALAAQGTAGNGGGTVAMLQVVEYYNAALDHYFITWVAAEIANLDAGATPTRWTRTGRTFKAFANPVTGTSQVCRFYIPPSDGNSHFFGRSAAECQATQHAQPDFVLEDPDYMHVMLPTAGSCPAATQPIYRVFNNRADANHRYTIDRAVRDQMAAQGWVVEGDGADHVVMCVPAQ